MVLEVLLNLAVDLFRGPGKPKHDYIQTNYDERAGKVGTEPKVGASTGRTITE